MARRRNRRRSEETTQFWITAGKWALILIFIGAIAVCAYMAGRKEAESDVSGLQEQIDTLRDDVEKGAARNRELEVSLTESQREVKSHKARLDAIAPSAELKALIAQLQQRLDEGIASDRLSLFISLANKPRNCQTLDRKRFYVRIGSRLAPENMISYSGGISVTAEGMAGSGALAGVFDPAQPVTISFAFDDEGEVHANGLLPLTHSFVHGRLEYRFTLSPGSRGLVEITGERCDLL